MTEFDAQTTTKTPRLALLLIFIALGAWMIGALYTWFFDPEMKFWEAAARQKIDWVEKMREKHGYVIGVVGGSTTTFGIDAEYIERKHGLPVANLGLHVGMDPEALVGFGLSSLREGDTLVLSLEPSILTEDYSETSKLGSKLSLILGRPEMLNWDQEIPWLSSTKALATLAPGGYHVMTMLGKIAMHSPLYRYSIDNLRPGGLQVTLEKRDFAGSKQTAAESAKSLRLSPSGVRILQRVRDQAAARHIRVLYLLPWSYVPSDKTESAIDWNSHFLEEVGAYVRIIREPNIGVHGDLSDFADSGQHLTESAAIGRSEVFAGALISEGSDSREQAQSEQYPNSFGK